MELQPTEKIRASWDKIAAGYDEFVTPSHLALAEEALATAGLERGMDFLDVAAGSGALSLPAARRGANVLATDLSPMMVDRLHERARREGVRSIEARVMDGHALDLPDASFDVAASQFGVMLFPDLPKALGEMARVTRSDGKVMLVVYGPAPQVEFLSFFIGAIKSVVPGFVGLPTDPPPLPFQVAGPERLRQALERAGLRDVRVTTTTERLRFASANEMWDWVVNSNPIGAALVADLTKEQEQGARAALEARLRDRAGDGDVAVLTNPVNIGIGTKRVARA